MRTVQFARTGNVSHFLTNVTAFSGRLFRTTQAKDDKDWEFERALVQSEGPCRAKTL